MKVLSLPIFIFLSLFNLSSSALPLSNPISPNSHLTPGSVFPTVTLKQLCSTGYTSTVRSVSASTKKKVFALYGINPKSGRYEIDHLISLELGGDNDIKNLWPQSMTTQPYNAKRKNVLENKLNDLVCSGKLTIKQAQDEIRLDWIGAYNKYIKN